MKRYLLGMLLVANVVFGMGEQAQMLEKITGIKRSAKESLRRQYPQCDISNPKDAVEKAIAETILQQEQWEQDIPHMLPNELIELWPKVSGWYWSNLWAAKINQRLQDLKMTRLP